MIVKSESGFDRAPQLVQIGLWFLPNVCRRRIEQTHHVTQLTEFCLHASVHRVEFFSK